MKDMEQIHLLHLQDHHYVLKYNKIALSPINALTRNFASFLVENDKDVLVFDDKPDNEFPCKAFKISEAGGIEFDKVYIFSLKSGEIIRQKLLASGVPEEKVSLFLQNGPDIIETITLDESVNFIKEKRLQRKSKLSDYIGEKQCFVVLGSRNYIAQCHFIEEIRKKLKTNIIWADYADLASSYDKANDTWTIGAKLLDLLVFLYGRKNKKNIIFFVHIPLKAGLVFLLRELFPEASIIAGIYDWLNNICPADKLALVQKQYKLPMDIIKSEYWAEGRIAIGEAVDAVLHKDGLEHYSVLDKCSKPKFFLPACTSGNVFQAPPAIPECADNLVFIGCLYSPKWHDKEIFDDVIFFDIFTKLSKQGFKIDAYDALGLNIIQEYSEYFADNPNVRIHIGAPLEKLLPQINGKHHWGYMLYDSEYKLVSKTIKETLPSKIYTYMALGLPIALSSEFECASAFVEKLGIGVCIPRSKLGNAYEILTKADYRKLQENVLRVRENFRVEIWADKAAEFINNLLATPAIRKN